MAVLIEITEVAKGVWKVKSHHFDETDPETYDFEFANAVDQRAADDFERLELRDLIEVLIKHGGLSERERKIIALFVDGWTFGEIAKQLKVSRQRVFQHFQQAIGKMQNAAKALGVSP